MTESEAKSKWCPWVRAGCNPGSGAHGPWNRWPGEDAVSKTTACIGSQCMAWKWDENPVAVRVDTGSVRALSDSEEKVSDIERFSFRPSTTHGSCGMVR